MFIYWMGKEENVCFFGLVVMYRMDDKGVFNYSVLVIDCLEIWKIYE